MFKSGFVSILGRTNVGKSSIINSLVGEKVAAIANKPQTTRTVIRAIVNRPNSQIIFIDTPGIHKPKSKLGDIMVENAFEVAKDVDVVVFVIEATSEEIGKGDRLILDKIKEAKKKTILVINKVDLVNKERVAKLIDLYKDEYEFASIIPVSTVKNTNLEVILDENKSILFSTHITTDLDKIADYITLIDKGEIILSDVKDDLLENHKVIKGDYSTLRDLQKEVLIGLRKSDFGFNALINNNNLSLFKGDDFIKEKPNLEDIMLYMTRR